MAGSFLASAVPVWAVAALAALGVSAAAADLRLKKIPNWLTYPAIAAALAAHTATAGVSPGDGRLGLTGSLMGLAVGFVPLMLAWLAGGVGGGDAKLMAAVGALGGGEVAIGVMLYGFIAAAVMALAVMIRRRMVRRTLRRVWVTLLTLVTPGTRPTDPTGKDSPTIPFGLALCVGMLTVIAERLL